MQDAIEKLETALEHLSSAERLLGSIDYATLPRETFSRVRVQYGVVTCYLKNRLERLEAYINE